MLSQEATIDHLNPKTSGCRDLPEPSISAMVIDFPPGFLVSSSSSITDPDSHFSPLAFGQQSLSIFADMKSHLRALLSKTHLQPFIKS